MKQSIFTTDEFKKLKSARGGKRQKSEEKVQLRVCAYLKGVYPHIIFTCDLASGMNVGKKIGGMNTRLRSSRGLPDLFIAQPKNNHLGYREFSGFFIELKKEGTTIFLRNGNVSSDPHITEQAKMLKKLRDLGYAAEFGIGFDATIKIIDEYLGGKEI